MFVIYLIDNNGFTNYLGYWTGKSYIYQQEKFLICESEITDNTKRYTSKKQTENSAKKLGYRFKVEEV